MESLARANESEETPFSVPPAAAAAAEQRIRFRIAQTNSGLQMEAKKRADRCCNDSRRLGVLHWLSSARERNYLFNVPMEVQTQQVMAINPITFPVGQSGRNPKWKEVESQS
jgi:hypothetical protein